MNVMFFEQTFDDINMEISYRECNLAIEMANHDISCLLDNYDQLVFIEKGEDEKPERKGLIGGIVEAFSRIISKIRKFLNSIAEGINQSFGDKLDAETYMGSETAQIRFSTDLQKVCNDIEKEYAHARKLVRIISKGTKLDEVEVANFLDSTNASIHRYGPAMLRTGVTMALSTKLRGLLKKMNGLTDEAEKAASKIQTGDTKQVKLVQKVLNGIWRIAGNLGEALDIVDQTTSTARKNMKKKDKRDAKKMQKTK